MSELGRLLREARTAKELSLADIESATRIRQKYLEALEGGEFAKLPRGTVARGFLRTYAAFLGLDTSDIIARYTQESGDAGDDIPIAEPGKPRLVDYRPLEVELSDTRPMLGWWLWVAAAAIVIALGIGGWWLLGRGQGRNLFTAFGPAPTATQTFTPIIVTATPKPTQTPPLPTPTSDLLPLPIPTMPATETPTPRPSPTPEVVGQIALELSVTQRTWVRVSVDGEIAEEGTLEAGITRIWEANQSITVRTGNAGGISLILNGEDLGPLGEVGQVMERTWVVEQGEVTETDAQGTPTPTRAPARTPTQTASPTPAG